MAYEYTDPKVERYSRQEGQVRLDALRNTPITIVGVGAIGRQVALQLAAIGAATVRIFDDDYVDESNIASQGYKEKQLGMLKVNATAEDMADVNGDIVVDPMPFRAGRATTHIPKTAVFSAVDRMDVRDMVFEGAAKDAALVVDGRMAAETMRVITARLPEEAEFYRSTLFAQAHAFTGGCTSQSTFYTASMAAGFMVSQFVKWLRGSYIDGDVTLYLPSLSLSIGGRTSVG